MTRFSTPVKLICFFLICSVLFFILGNILEPFGDSPLGYEWWWMSHMAGILSLVATVITVIIALFNWLFFRKPISSSEQINHNIENNSQGNEPYEN